MIRLKPHRGWLMTLGIVVILAALSVPLLRYGRAALSAEGDAHERAIDKLKIALAEAKADTQAAASGATLSPEVRRALLAPMRRDRAVAALGRLADAYAISAPRWTVSPDAANPALPSGVTSARLTLNAVAPEDVSLWPFLEAVEKALPGRARLTGLTLDRAQGPMLSAANLTLEATFSWLANAPSMSEAQQ